MTFHPAGYHHATCHPSIITRTSSTVTLTVLAAPRTAEERWSYPLTWKHNPTDGYVGTQTRSRLNVQHSRAMQQTKRPRKEHVDFEGYWSAYRVAGTYLALLNTP